MNDAIVSKPGQKKAAPAALKPDEALAEKAGQITCGDCSRDLAAPVLFCPFCGRRQAEIRRLPQTPEPQPATPAEQPQTDPEAREPKKTSEGGFWILAGLAGVVATTLFGWLITSHTILTRHARPPALVQVHVFISPAIEGRLTVDGATVWDASPSPFGDIAVSMSPGTHSLGFNPAAPGWRVPEVADVVVAEGGTPIVRLYPHRPSAAVSYRKYLPEVGHLSWVPLPVELLPGQAYEVTAAGPLDVQVNDDPRPYPVRQERKVVSTPTRLSFRATNAQKLGVWVTIFAHAVE